MELVTKYIFTWVGFDGTFEALYNVDGGLKSVEFKGQFSEDQRKALLGYMMNAVRAENTVALSKQINAKVTKVDYELTFDMFYEEFDNKQGRKVPLKVWNGMTPEDQLKAYLGIKPYKDRVKKQGVAQCYPETYLRQTRWDI